MNLKVKSFLCVFIISICMILLMQYHCKNREVIFQIATIESLLQGGYEGEESFKNLKKHGDFGIGTFENLDGEMIAIDGKFYQIKDDGNVYKVSLKEKTPFSVMTFFDQDEFFVLESVFSFDDLKNQLDKKIKNKNLFYAIRIDGEFEFVKARSVPKQNKPYKKLADVVSEQSEFDFFNMKGTLVGFYVPQYAEKINIPGFHFHFINNEKQVGGHLLDCKMKNVNVQMDETEYFFMKCPKQNVLDLKGADQTEIIKAESKNE